MIETSVLPSGIRLITEKMPWVHSVSIGFWVGTGSRDERDGELGISHFLEHLLFKGTPGRSARSIAEDIDAVGGDMNAYTSKEYTTFYLRLLARDLRLGVDILAEIMTDPAFRELEVDAERKVILEEALMHLDEPADVVYERFAEAIFPGHPLGREVLGTPAVITSVTVPEIRGFFDEHYRPGNIVVAAAGDVDHDVIARELDVRYGRPGGAPPARIAPSEETVPLDVTTRECEQAHLVLGVRGPDRSAPERYALSILNHTLGGGLSSRLFQKVREERGLCYSIVSDRIAYSDAGALAVSVGTAPERVQEVLKIVSDELAELAARGITDRELALAKGHLRADALLSLEDSGSRMGRLGANLLLHGEVLSIETIAERIEAVTLDDVATVAAKVLGGPRTLAVVGPFGHDEFDTSVLSAS
ncbi:MAG TPA: pitrilysin family protein [Acidimicrobiales bacterium]|jgi:predicted Zn-dependent peptidase|nr:pitrilysin family protein [Acidimicrobiales bacterium]